MVGRALENTYSKQGTYPSRQGELHRSILKAVKIQTLSLNIQVITRKIKFGFIDIGYFIESIP